MSGMPLLLAMHSCTECFGVALQDRLNPQTPNVLVFEDGRGLSNSLISRVESLLPRERWRELDALAVATGPGGFDRLSGGFTHAAEVDIALFRYIHTRARYARV